MSGFTFTCEFGDNFNKVFNSKYDTLLDKSLNKSIVEAETICIRESPVKTGTLRRSIGHSHPNFLTVELTGAKHWKYVQFGTSPHVITPRNSTLLHWKDKTGEYFAKKVNHPGTKANPFVTRTLKKIQSTNLLEQNFIDVLKSEGIL